MVRSLFSVLWLCALAIACVSGGDGARGGNGDGAGNGGPGGPGGPNGAGGATANGGGAANLGGAAISGAGVPGSGGAVVGNGGAAVTGGSPAGGGDGPGPLCGAAQPPANKGRCTAGATVAKGSALTIHDFEDPGPDSDYLGVFFGDGRSGKWFDSHDVTSLPVVTMAAEATTGFSSRWNDG